MSKRILAVLIATALCAPSFAQESTRRPMTVDDALNMVRVGTGLISPDGAWVLVSKSELDWKKNKRKTTYYKVPATGGEAIRFIGEAGGSSFQFSPGGTYLTFLRGVGEKKKKNQIFLMRTDGGEAVQLTRHKSGVVGYKWAADESKIFFSANEARSEAEEKEHKNGADVIFVDEGPNGQREGRWRNLWVFDVKTKTEARLTDEKFILGSFDVAPDGRRVVFAARRENRRNQRYLSELYLYNLPDSSITRLTENQAPESRPLWSPDGASFAYLAPDDQKWELRQEKIWVMTPATRAHRMVSGPFAGRIGAYVWSPDARQILFSALQKTSTNLYALDVASGSVSQRTHLPGSLRITSFSRDRSQFAYIYSDFTTPPDVFAAAVDDFNPTRLTDANPWIRQDLQLASAEVIRWKSRDGLEIEGLLHLPIDYKSGQKLPLLLHIHGGPAGVFTNSFSARYHIYAGLGYASLSPNVRGSSGYSDVLLRGNMHDIGGGDFDDLMTGVDEVIRRGIADPERLGVRGWSYGGILGGVTITKTKRFKAASLGAMVSDWTSEYGPGFNYDVRLWYIGGTPWDSPEAYRQMSALTHAANVATPTLLLHGMSDRTDTEPQSMNFYAALKDLGKTVRYIRFPREPHGFREPRHQRIRDIEEIRWMQKYVLGKEWTPWVRQEEKKEKKAGVEKTD